MASISIPCEIMTVYRVDNICHVACCRHIHCYWYCLVTRGVPLDLASSACVLSIFQHSQVLGGENIVGVVYYRRVVSVDG